MRTYVFEIEGQTVEVVARNFFAACRMAADAVVGAR